MNKLSKIHNSKLNKFVSNPSSVESTKLIAKYIGTNLDYKPKINWYIAIPFAILNVFSFWGLFIILKGQVRLATILWMLLIAQLSFIGVSVGAHRCYSHKSFKAKPFLEAILIALYSITGSYSIFNWVRIHRVHHRYSDTDADPHNAKRGLFFCYVGWFISERNDYVRELIEKVDIGDLLTNKFLVFQDRYIYLFNFLFCIYIPVLIPVYFHHETWWNSFLVIGALRYALQFHWTFIVVVVSHGFGTRPYDKNIQPTDSWILSIVSGGDGSHNFHHAFPWDYKNAEGTNLMSFIIWFCGKVGLASDIKVVSGETIKNRITRTGDGTHHILGTDEGKCTVTAIGPLHPLNPTYRSIKDPEVVARIVGPRSMFYTELQEMEINERNRTRL